MDKQQANRNRTYDFRCRKSFRTSSGNMISRGQIFQARVSAFHSGNAEFFRFRFGDEDAPTDVPCLVAEFHSGEESQNGS